MRLLALDLDHTLAGANRLVEPSTVELLRRLERGGARLMLLSGKPAIYLAGLLRQIGLTNALISGENGIVTLASAAFPPIWDRTADVAPVARDLLARFRAEVSERFGDRIWLQPNVVNVSVFWRDGADASEIVDCARQFVRENSNGEAALRVYEHHDAVEVTAPNVDKGVALAAVMADLGIAAADVVAVGDSGNDVPMFGVAGYSVGINFPEADRVFSDIDSALEWLLTRQETDR